MRGTLGLTHLQLAVSSLPRSVRFYRSVFGMEKVDMHDGPPGFAFLRTPGSREIFTLNGTADQAGEMGGIQHFGFVVPDPADIDRLIRLAKKNGGKLLRRGKRGEEKYAFLADPDGYTIEIFSS